MPAEGALRDGATAGFELIETLRWQADRGFVRLERHLTRLSGSAEALGFRYDPELAREALQSSATGEVPLRMRLALARDGKVEVKAVSFAPLEMDTVWAVRIARTRLNSSDALLRHKTTRRALQDAARAEFPREDADEVLLLNERGEVCEGTITSLFADFGDGTLVTPPLGCGLLPGVLRGELVENRQAVEEVLTEADLARARILYVGNSLRGLVRVRLA